MGGAHTLWFGAAGSEGTGAPLVLGGVGVRLRVGAGLGGRWLSMQVVMSAETLLGGHKDRFDAGLRALQGGKKAGPRELQRIREREVGVLYRIRYVLCPPSPSLSLACAATHAPPAALAVLSIGLLTGGHIAAAE